MNKALIIVFVKNIQLGKVKTRLAKTIGNQAALEVYSALVNLTESVINNLDIDKRIYFSNAIEKQNWGNLHKAVQKGDDLGERMKNAFQDGFNEGYNHIILIGTDLADITASHIQQGFSALNNTEVVFGPAEDGGYYLIGLTNLKPYIFENKPWSEPQLLNETLNELNQNKIPYTLLETLNDIDTFEDLEASTFYKNNITLQTRINTLHD